MMSDVTNSGERRPLACSSRRLAGNTLRVPGRYELPYAQNDPCRSFRPASRRTGQASGLRSPFLPLLVLLLTFHFSLLTSHAAPPDRREIWVPVTQLNNVLKQNPRAVLLTKAQYDTLLRDAGASTPDPTQPPIPAVVEAASYTATPAGETLQITGTIAIEVLTDDWTVIPLDLNTGQLGQIQLDGTTAARAAKDGLQLVVRGKGRHTVTLTLSVPIQGASCQIPLPASASGTLQVVLPPGVTADAGEQALVSQSFPDRTEILHAFSGVAQTLHLSWYPSNPSGGVPGSLSQVCSFLYQIDAATIHADLGLTLSAAMGRLPDTLHLPIPASSKITEVIGDDIASWTLDQSTLTIQLKPVHPAETTFRVLVETPLATEPATSAISHFPFLTVANTRRISGVFGLLGLDDIAIRTVHPGLASHPVSGIFTARIENDPHFAGVWQFDTAPGAISAEIARLTPSFDADLDTGISFQQDGIHLDRSITLHPQNGQIFTLRLHLPAGEELLGLTNDGDDRNAPADYRQDGDALIVTLHHSNAFHLQTRIEPDGWPVLPDAGRDFSPSALTIDDAGKISGYLAVQADPSFRVETLADDGLEPRDGRITPVKGDFAWFGRGTAAPAALKLRVTRRQAEITAQVAGYALPTANTLEINAHIDYQIARSGVRTLRVRIPSAENFHLDGPGIAERTLGGDQKDTWTITFQKEQTGNYGLEVTGQIPIARDDEKSGRFQVLVPSIEPLDAPRFGGTWAIEANTDTEIHFETSGLNELDNLRAPTIAGYTPQHRIIGVFGWLGTGGSLTLQGERHTAATLPAIIVDRLELTSILSTSGKARHQVRLTARNAGEQFLEVRLPAGARLWSVTLDQQPVKPVASGPDAVRIALPQQDPRNSLALGLVYETTGREWTGSGQLALAAPKFDPGIPILQSQWTVWLPDGQSYERLDSNLPHTDQPAEELLLAGFGRFFDRVLHPKIISTMQGEPDTIAVENGASANSASLQQMVPGSASQTQTIVAKPLHAAGLLPLALDLQPVGTPVVFEGAYAADWVRLSHLDWWSRGQRMWVWLVLGGAALVGVGHRKPLRALLWGMLVFTFIPICLSRAWTLECNALLAGWIAAFAGVLIWRWCRVKAGTSVEALQRRAV